MYSYRIRVTVRALRSRLLRFGKWLASLFVLGSLGIYTAADIARSYRKQRASEACVEAPGCPELQPYTLHPKP